MPRGNKNADIDRRDMMKYLGAGGAAAVAGCGGGGGDGGDGTTTTTTTTSTTDTGPVEGGRMTIGTISEARGLNPLKVGDGATSDRVYMMMDGGMSRKDEETVAPFWFESWELSDSLDVVNIKLRENLSFGEPGDEYNYSSWGELTAETYLQNITEIFRSDWYPYTYSYNFYVNNQPIQYTKEGKYSIRAELPAPRPFYFFASGVKFSLVIPEEIVQRYAPDKDADGLDQDPAVVNCAFNGNLGPWDLNKWNRQSIIVYDAADEWYMRDHADEEVWSQEPNVRNWENAPYFDQFAMQVFDSENTMRQALRAGQIHYASIPATKVETFKNDSNIQVTKNPYISYSDYTGMNHRANGWMGTQYENQFRNKKVRHAVANCFNRNFVVENILDGEGATQGTLHPSWGPYYPDNVKTFEWTIERARQLFAEGTNSNFGYTGSGNSGQLVGPDGEQVELKCVYVSGTLDDLRAEYLKSRLEEAGIAVNLETTGWAPLLINYFYTNNPAPGYSSGNIGFGENNSGHPSIYNWGPWNRAISSQQWDLMLTLGFSYGPYDPAGVVDALYGEQSAFNAYGYTPSFPLSQWATDAVSASTQEEAEQKINDIFLELSKDQPSVFESNYYGFNGWWKTVRGLPESPRPSYFSDVSYEQLWFSDGGSS